MKFKLNKKYNILSNQILNFITNFKNEGKYFVSGKRNTIKLFELENEVISIKSFKKPNIFNKIVYCYFRKSKARRSFEFASKLIEFKIGTPQPVAYFENYDFIGLKESYYACEHLESVFEFREILQKLD